MSRRSKKPVPEGTTPSFKALVASWAADLRIDEDPAAAADQEQAYSVFVRVQDRDEIQEAFSFPFLVVPFSVAHRPFRVDILEEPLRKYRPTGRFAGSNLQVKHALLVQVCDLLIRPLDNLHPGTLAVDRLSHRAVYTIVISADLQLRRARTILTTAIYSSKLRNQHGSRNSYIDALRERDLACPITLNTGSRRQGSHLVDHNVGHSLFQYIARGLHDEAVRTNRYGAALDPWRDMVWMGTDMESQRNQLLLDGELNLAIDEWAFFPVFEKCPDDEAIIDQILHHVDIWDSSPGATRRVTRTLPAYVFVNFNARDRINRNNGDFALFQDGPERTLSGISTVWFRPGVVHATRDRAPRPVDWLPLDKRYPPPYMFGNTLVSRLVKMHRTRAVDSFAAKLPQQHGVYAVHECQKLSNPPTRVPSLTAGVRSSKTRSSNSSIRRLPTASPVVRPRPGGDSGSSGGGPGGGSPGPGGQLRKRPATDSVQSAPRYLRGDDGNEASPSQKRRTAGAEEPLDATLVVGLTLLSLAAAYSRSDADVDVDSEYVEELSEEALPADSCAKVAQWLACTGPSTEADGVIWADDDHPKDSTQVSPFFDRASNDGRGDIHAYKRIRIV